MSEKHKIRYGWLNAMYIYTIVGAGGFGLGMIAVPNTMQVIFKWPIQDPIVFGIAGSVFLSFALLSVLGLKSPLKFIPVLLLQFTFKVIWLINVVIPLILADRFQPYAILHVVIFSTYIIGDLIAIPFPYVFGKETEPAPERVIV